MQILASSTLLSRFQGKTDNESLLSFIFLSERMTPAIWSRSSTWFQIIQTCICCLKVVVLMNCVRAIKNISLYKGSHAAVVMIGWPLPWSIKKTATWMTSLRTVIHTAVFGFQSQRTDPQSFATVLLIEAGMFDEKPACNCWKWLHLG